MKKIIAAFDGLKYSEATRNYAINIAKQTNTHLVGVFLDDRTYTSYKIYDLIVEQGATEAVLKKYDEKDKLIRMEASSDFEKACNAAGIEHTVHHDNNIAIQELKHESIYADLLIIDAKETLTHYSEKQPTRFIRDLLGDVQCPVLLVQGRYKPLKKIILLYDGEPSSVFAIKMFSYMLQEFADTETEVITVNPDNKTLQLPDGKLMKEFMKRHFPKAEYKVMKGWAEDAIVKHLKQEKQNALIVLGAYRRGSVSRWFRESMADILMKETKLPLFIAHNK
jgi:nucleotide-binding universal stress UspA family protein